MKSKKGFRKIISSIIAILVIGISFLVYAMQEVKIEIIQVPDVDIILTKSKTSANLTSFEDDLKAELVSQGVMTQSEIDAGKLKVSSVETQMVESQETLSWVNGTSSTIGSLSITNGGKNVSMTGNTSLQGKNAIWILPEQNQDQDFNFGYSINFGDSFNAAGMLLRVQENSNGYLEGYMLSFNNTKWKNSANSKNGALWHFVYNKNNSTPFTVGSDITLISGLNISTSGNLNVKVTDTKISISGGGLSEEYVYEFPEGKEYGTGYGFFSDHYSHGCNQIGSFTLTNIDLKLQISKKFTEVLQAPDWREGSSRILLNVEDGVDEQFSNQNDLTAIISKLMNNDVYYIGWGTESNSEQIQEVISKNDGKGTYIANNSDDAIKATVDYIKTIIKGSSNNTIIAGESTNVKITSPASGVVETPTEQFPNGVWKVNHDYNYYENGQGQYEEDGLYSNNLISRFDNVGKYSIYHEDRLITDVYAHRRPVATFDMNFSGQEVKLQSKSYDLDIENNSDNSEVQKQNNGIQKEKWEYKKIDDASWTLISDSTIGQEVSVQLEDDTDYIIRLTVTDYQDTKSVLTKNVTLDRTQKPEASFTIGNKNKTLSVYETLDIKDESHDPSGEALTSEWTVSKIGENNTKEEVYVGEEPLINFSTEQNEKYGVGTYQIQLIVSKTVNGQVISSDPFKQEITVTKDTTAPNITIDPTTKKVENEDINIDINIKDEESGLKSYKYAVTESKETANESEYKTIEVSDSKEVNETIKISTENYKKELYLHIIAQNNDDVASEERISGPYYIEPVYGLFIYTVDKDDITKAVSGATYSITGEYADGTTIEIAKDVVTDSKGAIIIDKARLENVVKLRINNTKAATGYSLIDYKSIKLTINNYNIVVDKDSSSKGIDTSVSENGKILGVAIAAEKSKFEIKVKNQDNESGSLIANSEFSLKLNGIEVAKGITDENGETVLNAKIGGINKSVEYILEQTSVNESYKNVKTAKLNITFSATGEIKSIEQVIPKNTAFEIADSTKAEILVKNTRIDNSSFGIKINVKNNVTGKAIEGSKYKVLVEGTNNLQYTTETGISDSEGNIELNGLYGTGILKLTFIHTEAAEGYRVEDINRYITINRSSDGTIEYNNASMENIYDKAEDSIVYVHLTNALKPSENALKIRVNLSNNENVKINDIGMKIYSFMEDNLLAEGKTNEDGILEIEDFESDGEGELIYKLVTNDEELLGASEIYFKVSYDKETKRINGASKLFSEKNNNLNAYFTKEDTKDVLKYTANLDFDVTPSTLEGTNKLIISQYGNEKMLLPGVTYKTKITADGISPSINVYTTDENGKAEITLPDTTGIKIEIAEISTVTGYKLDSKTKTISLNRAEDGSLKIESYKNISEKNISKDNNGNIVLVAESKSVKDTSIVFNIAKTDENNKLALGGATFDIIEETTGYKQTVTSDENGYVSVETPFEATYDGLASYIFEIKETSTVYPYQVPSYPIKMEVALNKNNSQVTYDGVSYLKGDDLLQSDNIEYDDSNNKLNISLKIKNFVDKKIDGRLYDLDIKKVDKNGNIVDGSKYDIEIRPYAESSIVSNGCSITDNAELENLAIKQDKTTIILKEVKEALGCNLDSDIKIVTLTINSEGEIECVKDTTSGKNLQVNIKDSENGEKSVVEITITAEEPQETSQPIQPETPDDTEEQEPKDTSVTIKLFNKQIGDWNYNYGHWYWYKGIWWTECYTTETASLNGAQRLLRIFGDTQDAKNHNFKFIDSLDTDIDVRLVNNGKVDEEIYETAKAQSIENSSKNGTHEIKLYNDYKNKTVEFTVKQNVPMLNYKKNSPDAKFIITFDENGKVKEGSVTQGSDLQEIAIGGISADGVVDNIKLIQENRYGKITYTDPYSVQEYNSIGKNEIFVGLLNETLNNPLKVNINLKDSDTDEGLNGEVGVTITDETEDKVAEALIGKVQNGKVTITSANTYANRKLFLTIRQTGKANYGSRSYMDTSSKYVKFEVELDDLGNIEKITQVDLPDNIIYEGQQGNIVEYTIKNYIDYNFVINVKKLDENGNGLQGVRIKTISSVITNMTKDEKTKVFEYNSSKTDEEGNVKLKAQLPKTGSNQYYGKTLEFKLDEYVVPENYIAKTGMKILVKFDNKGNVEQAEVLSGAGDDCIQVTGKNNLSEDEKNISSVDISLTNNIITSKPALEITNADVDNIETKISGSKYKINVWDEAEYTKQNLNIDETKYSEITGENGYTKVNFDRAHALRTMIYQIQEIGTSDSYSTNKDIILKVVFDKEGKVQSTPTIVEPQQLTDSKGRVVKVAEIVGNPVGSTNIQISIRNELKPRFSVNISKYDTEGKEQLKTKEFKVEVQEKTGEDTYSEILEERTSKINSSARYTVELKTNPTSKTMLYTIYEKTGNEYTKRGNAEITFDQYGNIESGKTEGKYINNSTLTAGGKSIDVRVTAELFRMQIAVEDLEQKNYSLAGYAFNIENSKGETSDVNAKSNAIGQVIEIIGEVYKGETITYKIAQAASPINYNSIPEFTVTVEFTEEGKVKSCTPTSIQDVYTLVTTEKDEKTKANIQMKLYTTPASRNYIEMTLKDEEDENKLLSNASYKVNISNKEDNAYIMGIEKGKGYTDLGSYKNNTTKTITYTLTQTETDEKYMINDKPIQLAITYNNETGLIEDANIVATDGYAVLDTQKTIGTDTIYLSTVNRLKTVMNIEEHSTQSNEDKVVGSKFKIIEDGKSNLYSDTKVTNSNGEATLYVGPYYRGTEVHYNVANTTAGYGFKAVEDSEFTLTYDENGKIVAYDIPENMQEYMAIEIPEDKTHDISISFEADPLLTIGVDALDGVTNNKLIGGKYEISQVNNNKNKGTAITENKNTGHAVLNETPKDSTSPIEYQIVEKGAPVGYKYKNKDKVIGTFALRFDANGYIYKDSDYPKVTSGYDYIEIKDSTDKNGNYDLDLQIKYDEIEEFNIVIENENMLDNTKKIESDFNGQLSNGQTANVTTDAETGIGVLSFGKITSTNTKEEKMTLIISQSNIKSNAPAIAPIRLGITFDESGKIKDIDSSNKDGYAQLNAAYTIDSRGQYSLKITVKNNPSTSINIVNVADGDRTLKLESTHILSSQGMTPVTMITQDGEASTILESVPKNKKVTYTLKQTDITRGYEKNKPIIIDVDYNSDGIIKNITPKIDTSTASESQFKITYDDYQINLEINNRQIFEIYLETLDAFNSNIKIENVSVNIENTNEKNSAITLKTDENGLANAPLGSTIANGMIDYKVSLINSKAGYDSDLKDIEVTIRVIFGANGEVLNCVSSDSSKVEVNYGNGSAIELKVKYVPLLVMDLSRRNVTSNENLNGRNIKITSSTMDKEYSGNTNSNGEINNINAGKIVAGKSVDYTITEEYKNNNISKVEALPVLKITVVYDELGNISDVTSNDSDIVKVSGIGTRKLDVDIGSVQKTYMSIVDVDYYMNTERLSGEFEIKSSKGESAIITGTTTEDDIIKSIGTMYPSETIDYTIHQIKVKNGYAIIPDTKISVTYSEKGTISKVTSSNTDYVTVKTVNQISTDKKANIKIEVHSKPNLYININVKDKTYGSGVKNIGFKVTDSEGNETTIDEVTNENGTISIPVGNISENKIEKYKITQTNNAGGYIEIPEFEVVVEYGNYGTIVENGTYVVNANEITLTQKYSEKLYQNKKLRGIELNISVQKQLGIGIQNVDSNDNKISGIEYTVVAKDIENNEITQSARTMTNENGETVQYLGELPKNKIVEYTISEVQAPRGFRKAEDTVIRVHYDANGRISAYTVQNASENTVVEVATSKLLSMDSIDETAHIKVKIVNDNKITFKLVNKQTNVERPIKGASFHIFADDENGTSIDQETNNNGEIVLNNIEAMGNITFNFNQTSVPEGISENAENRGYITINKSEGIYQLNFVESSDNLQYNIDSEQGIVTVTVYNDSDLLINLYDVDARTKKLLTGAEHKLIAQYGEINDSEEDILNGTDNKIVYNNGEAYSSDNGLTAIKLGDTYQFANKKVIFTVETPKTVTNYDDINNITLIAVFDSKGAIKNVETTSYRLLKVENNGKYTINAIIAYGDNDTYTIKVVKEKENSDLRINGAKFNVTIAQNGETVENYENQVTSESRLNDILIESGILEFGNLQYRGKIKVTLNETEAPEGYEKQSSKPIEVEFDVELNRMEDGNVALKVNNSNENVSVNEHTKEITITVKNTQKISLKLINEDVNENVLFGMNYNIMVQEKGNTSVVDLGKHTTDDNGTIEVGILNKYENKDIIIRLEEEKDYRYQQIAPIVIEAHIDEEGKIAEDTLNIISGEDNVSNHTNTSNGIELTVINKLESYMEAYKIHITKVDKNDPDIKLSNVYFQVRVTLENGNKIYKAVYTDDGVIDINDLTGNGKAKIELKEVPLDGYQWDENNGYYTYEIEKTDSEIKKISTNTKDSSWDIDNVNNVININIENEPIKIGLAFVQVDSKNNDYKLQGAEYKLINKANNKEYNQVSDKNGIVYFLVDKEFGSVQYTLEETKAPTGYELDETPKTITVNYNLDGLVENTITGTGIILLDQKSNYIKYQVENNKQNIGIADYNIEIQNVNKANMPISNNTYKIDIKNAIGTEFLSTTKATDVNGNIDISNVSGAGKVQIYMQNTIAAEGYQLNSNSYVELYKDEQTGTVKITNTSNANVNYNAENNTLKIKISSNPQDNKYVLKLNVLDDITRQKITDTNSKFEININGKVIEKNVDENGQIIIPDLTIDDVENFNIQLKEVKAPSKYDSIEKTQEISVDVEKVYGVRTLKKINILSGSNIEEKYTSDTSIELNVLYGLIEEAVRPPDSGEVEPPEADLYIRSEEYNIMDGYISNIQPQTVSIDFITNLDTNGDCKVYDMDGKELDITEYVATNMKLVVTKKNQEKTFILCVKGDVDGNAKANFNDMLRINKYRLNKCNLQEAELIAADVDGNGKADFNDMLKINKYRLGKIDSL